MRVLERNFTSYSRGILAITMYKVVNDHFPLHLHNLFQKTLQIDTCNLWDSAHNLFIPRPLSGAGKRSLYYRVATLWNSLPTTAKTQTTLTDFIESLPTYQSLFVIILVTSCLKLNSFYINMIKSSTRSNTVLLVVLALYRGWSNLMLINLHGVKHLKKIFRCCFQVLCSLVT